MTVSVLLAGVGGQGLVLATRITAQVAFRSGFDVKTSDVIGLAQRGGMVWGSVRFGDKVHSPLVPKGQGDFLLATELLEGLRWIELLKPQSVIIMAKEAIFPNRVLLGKEAYPQDAEAALAALGFRVKGLEAGALAHKLGNARLANTILLGALSTHLPFPVDTWAQALKDHVPPKTVNLNLQAFEGGRDAARQE
jgi:indolepyruvate ferredoxin oxidoreductase beta subunit